MSYVRIDSSSAMKYISEQELNEWLLLVRELYLVCFGEELSCEFNMPPEEDIIYTFFGH